MQFFVYYVFWPFVLGAGFIFLSIMGESPWTFMAIWLLPWLTWPIGTYRRRQMNLFVEQFKKEADEEGGASMFKAFALALGPVFIMVLSGHLGAVVAPVYMEEMMNIDVRAQIEEVTKRAQEGNGYQGTP